MINLRAPGVIAEQYEPVVVDHHALHQQFTDDDANVIPVEAIVSFFTQKMREAGYKVYATSIISKDHHQVAYLRDEMYEKAQEDFLRSDRNSIGSNLREHPNKESREIPVIVDGHEVKARFDGPRELI